jgi:hypothetical protein
MNPWVYVLKISPWGLRDLERWAAYSKMPAVNKVRMFTPSGLFQVIVFLICTFKVLEIEYVLGEEVPVGMASPFLLMFVGLGVVASAMNTG